MRGGRQREHGFRRGGLLGRLLLLNQAAQQGAVGGVGGGAAQALAGQHGALVVGGLGQQQMGRLAIRKGQGQLLQLAHFGRPQGGGAFQNVQKSGAGHGGKEKGENKTTWYPQRGPRRPRSGAQHYVNLRKCRQCFRHKKTVRR